MKLLEEDDKSFVERGMCPTCRSPIDVRTFDLTSFDLAGNSIPTGKVLKWKCLMSSDHNGRVRG